MDTCDPAWTPGYEQFGRFYWYSKTTGSVHRPLQPAGHGPGRHRRQVQQGLSMMSGHQAGRFDVGAEQPTVATGSYYNPLAADMAVWGILIQPPRNDGVHTTWHSETGWRQMAWNNPRALEQKKLLLQAPTLGKPQQQEWKPPVSRLRKAATR